MSCDIPSWAIRCAADHKAIEMGCVWDSKRANRIVEFNNKHFKTQFSRNFKLTEEQSQVLQALEGWRLPNSNRRFATANLHVPKKSFGKTMLCAALSFYELFASGEPSSFIVTAAPSRENASQIFSEVAYSVERSVFADFCDIKRHSKEMVVEDLNSRYRSLASDAKRLHGFNCSLAVIDECHCVPATLWQALRYSTAARPNGLVLAISTAGENCSHWYHDLYLKSKKVLSGEDLDITHYAVVNEMDEDGDPFEEKQWLKANPLLGNAWCSKEKFERELEAAKSNVGEFLNFLRLRLNKWQRSDDIAYFEVSHWGDLEADISEDRLKECTAAIGVDLSEVCDPSSVSITWDLGEGKYHTRCKAWVPARGVELRSRETLKSFREFKDMTITDGDMLDEREVFEHLKKLCETYRVNVVNFDPRSAYVLSNRLAEEGYRCERVTPSARYFNAPMVELRKSIEEKRLSHDGSEWLKFCLGNIRIKVNNFDEVYPVRKRSIDKIDGGISCCLSLLGLLQCKDSISEIIWN